MADTTAALTVQNGYSTTLSTTVSSTDTVFVLATLPTGSQGFLTIDEGLSSMEVIFFTSKGANYVQCTSIAQGRGQDGTSAVGHTSGAVVKMKVNAGYWKALQDGTGLNIGAIGASAYNNGWIPGLAVPNTVTALGNRSYSVVFNSTDITGIVSNGMRLKLTRTVAAPTQCTSLNGTTQYYSKTSPAGMTFTNNFVVSAWVKLTSYNGAANQAIASRYNGTSGWSLYIDTSGRPTLIARNAAAANFSEVQSYQSIPLNKWVHVTGQLDMATFTATPTTSYIMIDGIDVPAFVSRGGTNPTALVQAGNLEVGTENAGSFFPGKIAQVAIYNAKVTQATILASMHQTLAGTETSLISAYSFNGASGINDLNANANNLTANGAAVATNADSPYGGQSDGTISSTVDYGIITKTAFATNTTLTVQVPEGCTIPTSGGVSAVSYSTQKTPYGLPAERNKWTLESIAPNNGLLTPGAINTYVNMPGYLLNLPIGAWEIGFNVAAQQANSSSAAQDQNVSLSTSASAVTDSFTTMHRYSGVASVGGQTSPVAGTKEVSLTTATPYYLITSYVSGAGTVTIGFETGSRFYARFNLL